METKLNLPSVVVDENYTTESATNIIATLEDVKNCIEQQDADGKRYYVEIYICEISTPKASKES